MTPQRLDEEMNSATALGFGTAADAPETTGLCRWIHAVRPCAFSHSFREFTVLRGRMAQAAAGVREGLVEAARRWGRAPTGRAAESRIRASLVDAPGWPEGWTLLHEFLGARSGRHVLTPDCRAAAARARAAGPDDRHVHRMLGILAFEAGQSDRAAFHLGQCMRADRSPQTAWLYCRALLSMSARPWIARFARPMRRSPVLRGTVLVALACAAGMRERDSAAVALLTHARRHAAHWLPSGTMSVPTAAELVAARQIGRKELCDRLRLRLEVAKAPGLETADGPGAVQMVSGDPRYLRRFLGGYAASLRGSAPGMPLHVHVIGPPDPVLMAEVIATADAVTVDRSAVAMDRSYFTVSRFLWLPDIAALWRRAVLVTDVDAQVAGDPRPVLQALSPHDVACRLTDHTLPWERAQVTALHLPCTDGGRAFAERYAAALAVRLLDGPLPYYSDQAVVWALSRRTAYGDGSTAFRLADLPLSPWLRPANQSGIAGKSRELSET